ncbi:MAG: hypothetical protein M1816_004217 [Peltula sp. TS41687]|nr:MAG: hypothetical protein M1816_004217 [Peltula sp. TS41687]
MAPTVPPAPSLRIIVDPSFPPLEHVRSRSMSVSFSPTSSPGTPSTPLHGPTTSSSASASSSSTSAIPIRWTKELEQRLRFAQKSLEEHQRKWSAGQEDYLDEVEALQELKKRFEKFMRRRSKQHSKEGRKFLRAASVGSSDVETTATGDDDNDNEDDHPQQLEGDKGATTTSSRASSWENDDRSRKSTH